MRTRNSRRQEDKEFKPLLIVGFYPAKYCPELLELPVSLSPLSPYLLKT
jgi:hypothetical protein